MVGYEAAPRALYYDPATTGGGCRATQSWNTTRSTTRSTGNAFGGAVQVGAVASAKLTRFGATVKSR